MASFQSNPPNDFFQNHLTFLYLKIFDEFLSILVFMLPNMKFVPLLVSGSEP
jgi:hypothetical protein